MLCAIFFNNAVSVFAHSAATPLHLAALPSSHTALSPLLARGENVPQVLDGIQIRRIRWKVDGCDAVGVEEVAYLTGFELRVVVVQNIPLLRRIETEVELGRGNEIYLQRESIASEYHPSSR
jgi:hypothetical protein